MIKSSSLPLSMVYSALGELPLTSSTCTLPLVDIDVNSARFLLCANKVKDDEINKTKEIKDTFAW